mgnify:FL=1
MNVINHLKKYLGWYILIPSIYLGFVEDGFMFFVALIALLKMPPFNWVDKGFDWSARTGQRIRVSIDAYRANKHPVISKLIYGIMVLISLISLYIMLFVLPECELC